MRLNRRKAVGTDALRSIDRGLWLLKRVMDGDLLDHRPSTHSGPGLKLSVADGHPDLESVPVHLISDALNSIEISGVSGEGRDQRWPICRVVRPRPLNASKLRPIAVITVIQHY
jgi:hypothetical protein